ncbi:hypothetical protein SeF3a_218 [Salmonella phage SeF3a]|nr:hypothetical protein SeF3a_218 [Salmonella phage SeF3a]
MSLSKSDHTCQDDHCFANLKILRLSRVSP